MKNPVDKKTEDKNVFTNVSVITKKDTFYINENGEFINYDERSKYDPRYCQELINFFNIPPYEERLMKHERGIVFLGRVANDMPLFTKFASKLGVSGDKLRIWATENKEFAEAMNQARDLQETILVTNSLLGLYTPVIAKFSLQNLAGWQSEKQDVFLSGQVSVDGLIDRISNSNSKLDLLEQKVKGLKLVG